LIGRAAALAALAAAIVLVAVVLLTSGSSYTVRADFQDAGGLVAGDDVMIGPSKVGSVQSIGLTGDGKAEVVMGLDGVAPLPAGTVARIYENSLSGLANKYVVLEPGPSGGQTIPDGGVIPEDQTHSPVGLDELFDTFDPLTRTGLQGFIQGQAASIQGRGVEANRTLQYLAPALASTSEVTAELVRDQPAFDALLVQGAQALSTLASRSQQLSDLVASTNATTGAIAQQSQALDQALTLLPGTLTHATRTFAGLNSTLDALDPLVAESKVASRRLEPFAAALRSTLALAIPTVSQLSTLIHNPAGDDLTSLFELAPGLEQQAASAVPALVQSMNDSQTQLDELREYTPDVVAAIADVGQASAYYDANGHYSRVQPDFFAFDLDSLNVLTPLPPSANRYQGLQTVTSRCPGGAVQPTPDGSAPWLVPSCQPSTTPPGP
jgi:phospholipid/cholesterol/gamma-HCH transport system substrate-binding protein